jgi:hypothetical protein
VSANPEAITHGWELFAKYAFPPNELGYCGPHDSSVPLRSGDPTEVAEYARAFDGAWPYLESIADATGADDPLDDDVVRSYWVGGPLLDRVDPDALLSRLRTAFTGQLTGMLGELEATRGALANHSFHVFVVYPWVRFLDADPTTPLRVLQSCRIRWGTVDSVDDEHVVMMSRPLRFDDGLLRLGEPELETVRWSKGGQSLAPAPSPGDTVSAHWDWVCGPLRPDEQEALAAATQSTLDLVNHSRERRGSAVGPAARS